MGFSADGRKALVHVRRSFATLGGRGYFVLLERTASGSWRVVDESTTVVS